MPFLTGLEASEQFKPRGVASKFVILTMHREASVAAKVMRAGASAFLLKHSAGNELNDAIDEVLGGRTISRPPLLKIVAALDAVGGGGDTALTLAARCPASHHRGPAHEGNRRHPRPFRSDGRNPQIRNERVLGAQSTAELVALAVKKGLG